MGAHTIPALNKAMDVLLALCESPGGSGGRALAASLHVSPSTCYRILQTFKQRDWIRSLPDGGFVLSDGLMPVARGMESRVRFETVLQPVLDRLARRAGVSVKVSVRRGDAALTVLRAMPDKPMALAGRPGAFFPLVYGSSGAVLLADLPDEEIDALLDRAESSAWTYQTRQAVWARIRQSRARGYAADAGGYQPQICTLSVPVRLAGGSVAAALTAMGLPEEFRPRKMSRLRALLREAGDESEAALGGRSSRVLGVGRRKGAAA